MPDVLYKDLTTAAILGYFALQVIREILKRMDVRRIRANGAGDIQSPATNDPHLLISQQIAHELKDMRQEFSRLASMEPNVQRAVMSLMETAQCARETREMLTPIHEAVMGASARTSDGGFKWYSNPELNEKVGAMADEVGDLVRTLQSRPCFYLDQPSRGLPEK